MPISVIAQGESDSTKSVGLPEFDDPYYDSLLNAYLVYDSLMLTAMDADSMSFLDIMESLSILDYKSSSLAVRLGYNSNILNAGRDFGFNQFGFTGSISYYHRSGLFSDITGYWNSDTDPAYNLSTVSFGYMGTISPKVSIIGSYDHLFYNDNADTELSNYPLTNSINLSSIFDFKYINVGIDYGFLFGEETAHRIRPNMSGVIRIKKLGFIDRVSILPSVSLLLGNQTLIISNPNYQNLRELRQTIGERRFRLLYHYRPDIIESLIIYETSEDNIFGLMNYSFSLPLYAYVGKFGLSAVYSWNIPIALPGEDLDLSTNTFFGVSLTYSIFLKK